MVEKTDGEIKEKLRNCEMGVDLILKNAKESVVIYTGADGGFYYTTENRTWAMGALRRTLISLDERERVDTRREEKDN